MAGGRGASGPGRAPSTVAVTSDPGELRILRSAGRYVVVDKPTGLLSVPGKGPERQDCVASRVAALFPQATGPLIVHRLDMETSGLLVLALDPDAHRALSRQFERRQVSKRYIAVLDGELDEPSGVVELPLRPDLDDRPRQLVDFEHGRAAVTRWRMLAREPRGTRVEFEPLTGKTHQLRVHAAAPPAFWMLPDGSRVGGLGRPILGDSLYGDPATAPRLLLHAARLAFADPDGGAPVECLSDAPF